MKQPTRDVNDTIDRIVKMLYGDFVTSPITERRPVDLYSLLPIPGLEQSRQCIREAYATEDELARETFIDAITQAKHPGPYSSEAYQALRKKESDGILESGEIWEKDSLDSGTRSVRVIGPNSHEDSVYWTSEAFLKEEGVVPEDWDGSFKDVDVEKAKSILSLPEQAFNGVVIYTVPETDERFEVYKSATAPASQKLNTGEVVFRMGGGLQYVVPPNLINKDDFVIDRITPSEVVRKADVAVTPRENVKVEAVSTENIDNAPPEEAPKADVAVTPQESTKVEVVSTENIDNEPPEEAPEADVAVISQESAKVEVVSTENTDNAQEIIEKK